MLRLVQLIHENQGRRVAVVEEPSLRPLSRSRSVYSLAQEAINTERGLAELISAETFLPALEYDAVYQRNSPWKLLPPADHPEEPGRCLVSGTGLTHKASAENRN